MLYRKYRPQTFSQVIGQEHVVRTLEGALTSERVGHAYLFTGPRGTGKTTIARLFAKALNCDKRTKDGDCDNKCSYCLAVVDNRSLDLIEIDAASQTGVDNIRELTDSARVAAPGGKYKIFIVDEVHMLSKSAFNALLKTLEEPPSHVIFVLATTEPHKIPLTVLSRVQRFDFKRLLPAQITEKLEQISNLEKIKIEKGGLSAIAASSGGALRDAEVALSKVIAANDKNKVITEEDIYETLGLIPAKYYPEFIGYLILGNKDSALNFITQIHSNGVDMNHFADGLIDYIRKILVNSVSPVILASIGEELLDNDKKFIASYAQALASDKLVKMLNVFISAKEGIRTSPIAQLPIELAILELLK